MIINGTVHQMHFPTCEWKKRWSGGINPFPVYIIFVLINTLHYLNPYKHIEGWLIHCFFSFWRIHFIQWIPDIWIHSKSFYNVVFSIYLRSNATERQAVLHFLGRLIYLELKIKSSFFKNYPKTYDFTMIFKYISINRNQPFEAATSQQLFFVHTKKWNITAVINFKKNLRRHIMRFCNLFFHVRLALNLFLSSNWQEVEVGKLRSIDDYIHTK